MAILAGTMRTYNAVGNREDLTDMIYDITPTDTPFLSMITSKGKAKGTLHEWQTDSLASASDNAVVEGNDATFSTPTATTRLGNRTQIAEKTVSVSGTQEAVDKAGRDSQYRYELAKRMKEIKRDMETTLTGNYASSAGNNLSPRHLGSLEAIYTTNDSRAAGAGAQGGYTTDWAAATDGSAGEVRSFTEALLKTALKNAWTQGGDPDYVMVGPVNKQRASGFAGIATLYRDTAPSLKQASVIGAADIYVSDFGQVKIIANRFSRERTAHVLDSRYWEVAYLRPFKTKRLADTGDNMKGMINVEYTLVAKNEASSAVIADLVAT